MYIYVQNRYRLLFSDTSTTTTSTDGITTCKLCCVFANISNCYEHVTNAKTLLLVVWPNVVKSMILELSVGIAYLS